MNTNEQIQGIATLTSLRNLAKDLVEATGEATMGSSPATIAPALRRVRELSARMTTLVVSIVGPVPHAHVHGQVAEGNS